jgi:hypothetical protein
VSILLEVKFYNQLVLYKYFLKLFNVDDFSKLKDALKAPSLEELDENNISKIYHQMVFEKLFSSELNKDILLQYDQNIVKHTFRISRKREEKIKWKYFQYLSLLFTEIYLDRYFSDKSALLKSLNEFVDEFNNDLPKKQHIEKYTERDLSKLAFWNATGSGKTLLMHINILQFMHYARKYGKSKDINKIILLTPNEGLSNQHKNEFELSDLKAELFSQDLFGFSIKEEIDKIQIIDIHKIKDEKGVKTFSVEAFEGNNLVLVDEGHRGSSGDDWKEKRDKLCEEGFSFEYSATFGQAIGAATGKKKEILRQEYAKCILFDYSYKFFYEDGYGKDYKIFNMQDDNVEEQRNLYLTACVLSYYQQLKLFKDKRKEFISYRIEKPLWIFVGGKVTAVRTERGKKVSDVVDVLLFLSEFIKEKKRSIEYIERLLNGRSGLLSSDKKDLFENNFDYLINKEVTAQKTYDEILKEVFLTISADVNLHIDNLKGADGEIGLRAGDNDYFGVINVGDVNNLLKLCEENELSTDTRDFSDSLFKNINDKDSKINILIGSKKFSEGWSSWRVSTMGLMNIGKKEGSEIIQLFGRGVRLKGYNFSLKRSSEIDEIKEKRPKFIDYIETLNIFGIRSDYMAQFKEYLDDEGVPTEEPVKIVIPTISTFDKNKKLKTLQVKKGLNFKKNGPKPVLDMPTAYMQNNKVVLDWYPRIQAIQSRQLKQQSIANMEMYYLEDKNLAFLDYDKIYFEIQNFKNERSWYNLIIHKDKIKEILKDKSWYKLFIPKEELEFSSRGFKDVEKWQEIATILMKKYIDKFYKTKKKEWELPHLEYVEVNESDKKLIEDEYRFEINRDETALITKINQLKEAIEQGKLKDLDFKNFNQGRFYPFAFEEHLFNPLIHITKGTTTIKVKPVHLNEGERDIVLLLKDYFEKNNDFFKDKELYLLRNKAGKDGVGFFEADNFYPDFILWILYDKRQYVTFIDPKGLRNLKGETDVKIEFNKTIKDIQERLKDQDSNITLNSFIMSVTPYEDISWWGKGMTKADFAKKNVLFIADKEKAIEQMLRKIIS